MCIRGQAQDFAVLEQDVLSQRETTPDDEALHTVCCYAIFRTRALPHVIHVKLFVLTCLLDETYPSDH